MMRYTVVYYYNDIFQKMKIPKFLLLSGFFMIFTLFFVWTSGAANAITIANFPQGFTFTKNLSYGMTDPDVMRLQQMLNTNTATQVAASGAGSPGNETSYFGSLTEAAVVKFQQLYYGQILTPVGLTSGTGYVGTMTITMLNSIISSNTTATSNQCPAGYVCTPNNTNQINTNQNNNNQTPSYQSRYDNNNQTSSPVMPLSIYGPWVGSTQSSTVYVGQTAQFTSTSGGAFNYNCGQDGTLSGLTTYGTFYCTYTTAGQKTVTISNGGSILAQTSLNVLAGSASVTIDAQPTTGTNSSSATTIDTATTGTNDTGTQCPTGYVCTPNDQTSVSSVTTGYSDSNGSSATTNTGSTFTQTSFSLIASSPTTSTTASTSAKTATSTETLGYGTVTGVLPCTFNPGSFQISLNIINATSTATSTSASTTAALFAIINKIGRASCRERG